LVEPLRRGGENVKKPKSIYSAIAAGLGLVAVIISITLGIRQLIPDAKPPHLSAVFVLDVSDAMHTPLGDTTKLEAAQNSILQNVASFPGVSTSLRLVTDGCEAEYTDPTIGFATKNAARYRNVFASLATEPMSSYIEGLNSAANDLKTKADPRQRAEASSGVRRRLERCVPVVPLKLPFRRGSESAALLAWKLERRSWQSSEATRGPRVHRYPSP
jgi:hypothetical protein